MQGICVRLPVVIRPGQLENVFGCPAEQEKHQSATERLEPHHATLAVRKESFTVFLESQATGALLHVPSLPLALSRKPIAS